MRDTNGFKFVIFMQFIMRDAQGIFRPRDKSQLQFILMLNIIILLKKICAAHGQHMRLIAITFLATRKTGNISVIVRNKNRARVAVKTHIAKFSSLNDLLKNIYIMRLYRTERQMLQNNLSLMWPILFRPYESYSTQNPLTMSGGRCAMQRRAYKLSTIKFERVVCKIATHFCIHRKVNQTFGCFTVTCCKTSWLFE